MLRKKSDEQLKTLLYHFNNLQMKLISISLDNPLYNLGTIIKT